MVEQQIYQDQTKPKVKGKVFQTFLSSASNKQISLQIQITKEIENLWCFSHITAGAGHYQEGAGGQKRNEIDGIRRYQG